MCLCVHWFNPLVWAMYALLNCDIDLACDECVLRRFGNESRREYALTLIDLEARRVSLASFGSFFSKNTAEERIKAIMKFNKISICALILVAMLAAAGTAMAFAASPETGSDTSLC